MRLDGRLETCENEGRSKDKRGVQTRLAQGGAPSGTLPASAHLYCVHVRAERVAFALELNY